MGKTLASAVDRDPRFRLEWIHARNPISDEAFRDRYEADFEKVFLHKPDGILLATPLEGREKWIEKILQERIPLLAEKPLSSRYDLSRKLAELAIRERVPLLVNYVHSYSPSLSWVQRKLQDLGVSGKSGILGMRITMGQLRGRYREEGVETLLLSHLLAIVYKFFPEASFGWEIVFSAKDTNQNTVAVEVHSCPSSTRESSIPRIQLLADLSYPEKIRLLEIWTEKGTIRAEFGGQGRVSLATWEGAETHSHLEEETIDQSENLRYILYRFYVCIREYQTLAPNQQANPSQEIHLPNEIHSPQEIHRFQGIHSLQEVHSLLLQAVKIDGILERLRER